MSFYFQHATTQSKIFWKQGPCAGTCSSFMSETCSTRPLRWTLSPQKSLDSARLKTILDRHCHCPSFPEKLLCHFNYSFNTSTVSEGWPEFGREGMNEGNTKRKTDKKKIREPPSLINHEVTSLINTADDLIISLLRLGLDALPLLQWLGEDKLHTWVLCNIQSDCTNDSIKSITS